MVKTNTILIIPAAMEVVLALANTKITIHTAGRKGKWW